VALRSKPKDEAIATNQTQEGRLAAAKARAQRQAKSVNSAAQATAVKSGQPTIMGSVSAPKIGQSSGGGSHTSTGARGIVASRTPPSAVVTIRPESRTIGSHTSARAHGEATRPDTPSAVVATRPESRTSGGRTTAVATMMPQVNAPID
jgi:hypothetical protein